MKELKLYISEGFFNNIGANNIVKPVIDAIKDASMNNKIDSDDKRHKFADLLTSILKDIENNMKKGKFAFEYIRNDGTCVARKITITLEMTGSKDAIWTYILRPREFGNSADIIATDVVSDLYYEAKYSPHHSIANTIKVTEFKLS